MISDRQKRAREREGEAAFSARACRCAREREGEAAPKATAFVAFISSFQMESRLLLGKILLFASESTRVFVS